MKEATFIRLKVIDLFFIWQGASDSLLGIGIPTVCTCRIGTRVARIMKSQLMLHGFQKDINISQPVYRFASACPLPKGYKMLELEKTYLHLHILYKLQKGFPSPPVTLGFPREIPALPTILERYASQKSSYLNPWDLFFMLIESKNNNSPWEPTTFSFIGVISPHTFRGPKPFIPHAFVVQRHLVLTSYHENRSIKGLPQVDLSPAFGNLKYCWNKTYPCFVKQKKTPP